MELRPYQRDAVESIRSAYRGGARSVLFVLPTGGGKTVTFAHIAAGALTRDKRTLILAHRYELIDQISAAVPADDRIQVGMVQSVTRRIDRIEPPDFIVTDEAHHASADSYRRIYEAFPDAHHLGVTATPQRTDGRGLGDLFDTLVVGPQMRDLITDGWLADYRIFAPPERIDLKGVRKTGGDFVASDLESIVGKVEFIGDAIKEYSRRAPGSRAIVFCVTVGHAKAVAAQFSVAGFPAWSVDGSLERAERDARIASFRRGDTPILTSCDLVGEGFDVPGIETAILMRPTDSLIVYLQQCGRSLRTAEGKGRAVILDCVGNVWRHGMPCDARDWSLEGKKRGEPGDAPVKHCPECQAIAPLSATVCPECGYEFQTGTDKVEKEVPLVEIDKVARAAEMARLAALSYRDAIAEIKTPADVKKIATARKYKPGWCMRQAMEKFAMDPWQAAHALGYKPGIVFALDLHERRRAS